MVPLTAGGSQAWRAARRHGNRSVAAALTVFIVLSSLMGHSSLAGAQAVSPATDPGLFPATGYRIASPALLNYFQRRGGVRTFGYPISNEFPLLGKRVQIFQRHMLELGPDGTVTPASILDPTTLPIDHIDGLNIPPIDPDLALSAPDPSADDYTTQALTFVSVVALDTWNDMPVNFLTTYFDSVSCADAFGTESCDSSLLPTMALELWGLPTSLPTADPQNPDFVYQRFERGIMHFSQATGRTQGLLLGDWLKRVMIGVDLSPDLERDVRGSRLYAQYAPSRPLAIARLNDLPDTSLAQAFRADSLSAAGQMLAEPTLTNAVAQTATALAGTATALSATQIGLSATQVNPTTATLAVTATAAANTLLANPQPVASAVSNIPVVNVGCMGDEQMWFVPPRPRMGVHVQVTVTSQRHHDVRALALAGPIDPGLPLERVGPLGFMWTWTVQPTVEDFYQWTFYADGLRPCITSGFNAYTPLGATLTPTSTPQATNTPGPTATATPQGQPSVRAPGIEPTTGTCDTTIRIAGSNFGVPQQGSLTPPSGQVLVGSRQAQVLSWTNQSILIQGPPAGTPLGNSYSITVVNQGGAATAPQKFTLTAPPTGPGTPAPTTC